MSAYDRYLAQYSRESVEVRCLRCAEAGRETVWLATLESEYGQSWLSDGAEECPTCHADGDLLEVSYADPHDWDPRYEYDPERDG